METKALLGIDAGTQGLSVVLTDESLKVIAVGEGGYDMVPGLPEGCYEQNPDDWTAALSTAMADLRSKVDSDFNVLAIGISGQMHGEVLVDEAGKSLGPARLWCDARNEAEGNELTARLNTKMPKRITSARWLWTIRNQREKAAAVKHITTPAGWLSHQLTGNWNLGVGDAAGMFPIDQSTMRYDEALLKSFDALVNDGELPPLQTLLPTPLCAGDDAGTLHADGAQLLGLPVGIPVAPAEGDQPAALAGSLIGEAGMVSISFGTSVCANSVGDRAFSGVSNAVDHFCAPDGKPINMVWLRNGTTFMNTVVEMFGHAIGNESGSAFETVMPMVLQAAADCAGLLALPFIDDEPGLDVSSGGTAMIYGLNADNATPGNAVKAALLATMFNLKKGSEILDAQGFPRTELILTGGLTKTPELGQILADVMNAPVKLLASAEEGTAWGAALMAKFRQQKMNGNAADWSSFLAAQQDSASQSFQPDPERVSVYARVYEDYVRLLGETVCRAN